MSEAKKMKLDCAGNTLGNQSKRKNKGKRSYYVKPHEGGAGDSPRERFLKPGHRGFLITCNGHVRDCVRDSYRILNEYADVMYGTVPTTADSDTKLPSDGEEEDITVTLQKEAEAAAKRKTNFRFQSVDSGAMNCLFIQTSLPDPNEIVFKLMKDLSDSKKHKSRFILRMLPIEVVCRANLKDIMDAVGPLGDRYFLKEPKTYAILFHRRLNNDLSRESVIRELADLITAKNAGNKANLKTPDIAILVEVIKGLCCIGILREYYQLRKYNLVELVSQEIPTQPPANEDTNNLGDDVVNNRALMASKEKDEISQGNAE